MYFKQLFDAAIVINVLFEVDAAAVAVATDVDAVVGAVRAASLASSDCG